MEPRRRQGRQPCASSGLIRYCCESPIGRGRCCAGRPPGWAGDCARSGIVLFRGPCRRRALGAAGRGRRCPRSRLGPALSSPLGGRSASSSLSPAAASSLPSSSTTARSRSASRATPDCRAWRGRRAWTSGPPATPTPTCSSRSACSPPLLGVLATSRDRRRLGLVVAGLGLVARRGDSARRPARSGLDAGVQASRFAGATAVLEDGFYAELAAAAGLVLAGLLYYARPCRIRINSSGRAASARRRRPRRRASSRARVARRA